MTFHPAAWMTWTAAAAIAAQAIENPALLVVAVAALVFTAVTQAPERGPAMLMLKIAFVVLVARVVLFSLAGHPGGSTLFTLPSVELPVLLGGFRIGGPVSGEVVATSAVEGLRLAAVLACFGVFVSVVEPVRAIRLAPRFLFEAGLVVAIGATFVPSLIRTARDVREAQRLRGYRGRGVRAVAALALPVLSSTLERSSAIAESLESRGYGRSRSDDAKAEARARTLAFGGVLGASAGALGVTLRLRPPWAAWLVLVAGAAVLAAGCMRLAAHAARTRYRRERLRAHDAALIVLSLGHLALTLVARADLSWTAPQIPDVSLAGLAVVVAFAAPVVVAAVRASQLRRAS